MNATIPERIARRITVVRNGPWICHESSYARNSAGYAHSLFSGKYQYVHRVAYEIANGLIPKGLTVDHLCKNKICCNPAHLELVTRGENMLRGTAPSAMNARKTHCANGHPLEIVDRPRNKRGCTICINAKRRLRRALRPL